MLASESSATSKPENNKEKVTGSKASRNAEPNDPLKSQARSSVDLVLTDVMRDSAINCLNQFSSLLFRNSISDDLKKKALEKANDLVMRLICLESDPQDDDLRPTKKMRTSEGGGSRAITSQRYFVIPFALRDKLVDRLNVSLNAILTNVMMDQLRNEIAEQNDRLSIQLLSLPFKTRNGASDESDPFNDELQKSKAVNLDSSNSIQTCIVWL